MFVFNIQKKEMANIFTLENIDNFSEKLNLDDLYEKKKNYDQSKLELYNKLLNRVHVRIKTTSRQKMEEPFCWYLVPEIMIGVPRYDNALCISYIMDKLKENGFIVRYIHPNTLFISWAHFVPSYIRNEIKIKTGIQIDEHGDKIKKEEPSVDNILFKQQFVQHEKDREVEEERVKRKESEGLVKKTTAYQPQGIYNSSLFRK